MKCFESEPSIPIDQVSFIMARVGEIMRAWEEGATIGVAGKRKRSEIFVRWMFPREGRVSLNTDGASKGNPCLSGDGGIV